MISSHACSASSSTSPQKRLDIRAAKHQCVYCCTGEKMDIVRTLQQFALAGNTLHCTYQDTIFHRYSQPFPHQFRALEQRLRRAVSDRVFETYVLEYIDVR